MAKVLRSRKNALKRQFRWYRGSLLVSAAVVLGFPLYVGRLGVLPTVLLITLLVFLAGHSITKANTLKAGLDGERQSHKVMKKLSKDYFVLPNVCLHVNGSKSEIDHIVVGKNGIFVVETKNHNGVIEGTEDDQELIQHKTGRKGGSYSKSFYNPVKQVSTHVYRVSQLLKQNGYRHWVHGAVLFINPEATVNVKSQRTPIFSVRKGGVNAITDYIEGYETGNRLTAQECRAIAELIHKARVS